MRYVHIAVGIFFFPEYTEWNYVELKFRIRLTCIICDKVVDPIPTEEYKCINRTKLIDEMLDV